MSELKGSRGGSRARSGPGSGTPPRGSACRAAPSRNVAKSRAATSESRGAVQAPTLSSRAPRTRPTAERKPARTRKRLVAMIAVAALALSGLAARLVQIQGVDAFRYASYGSQEVYGRVSLPALRGAVYDRNGNLMAASAARVDVVADDYLATRPQAGLASLASILGLPARSFWPSCASAAVTSHSRIKLTGRSSRRSPPSTCLM